LQFSSRMLQWDSDDESAANMTRVSDALGDANYDDAKDDVDHDIDEMELLQLRNLVQQIKLQTVIGDNFMKFENQGSSANCLDSIVTPVTEEDVEAKYRQLVADHSEVVEERDQLAARVNQFTMQGGDHIHQKITQIEKERDEAKKQTEAAKAEVENLKMSQTNLKQFYQEKVTELGGASDSGAVVPLEDYNRLKELHFALNKQLAKSEQRIYQQQDDLHEAVKRAQSAEQQLLQLQYSQMWNQPMNGFNTTNSEAGILGNPVLHQILQMNQQLQHNNYRR